MKTIRLSMAAFRFAFVSSVLILPCTPLLASEFAIEIPTPRWSTIDAFRFGVPIPDDAPVSTQERAYNSPIWYTP